MAALRLLIGVSLACLLLRTFVALGLVMPVVVVGDSMAPRLVERDRVIVDRASTAWRPLQRWDRIVTRVPDDARKLAVKRVVALPGERVELARGDVAINGHRVRKSLTEQQRLRVPIYQEAAADRRWLAGSPESTRDRDGIWRLALGDRVRYQHPGDGVIRDELAINTTVSRRLNAVADLMLTFELESEPQVECEVTITVAGQQVRLLIGDRRWRVLVAGAMREGGLPIPAGRRHRVTFSLFDRQVLVAVGEQTLVELPLPPLKAEITEPQELAIRASGGGIALHDLTVWRDVYYELRPTDRAPAAGGWTLGPAEWLLIGDNQAVSIDSRNWRSGVPDRLIVGRVVGE